MARKDILNITGRNAIVRAARVLIKLLIENGDTTDLAITFGGRLWQVQVANRGTHTQANLDSPRTSLMRVRELRDDGLWYINLGDEHWAKTCACHVNLIPDIPWILNTGGYAVGASCSESLLMHRIVNRTPDGYSTDHINGDRLDNRCCNLRTATQSINAANSHPKKPPVHGYRGILPSRNGKRWEVRVKVKGKKIYVGTYDTPEEAARERDKVALACFGKNTYLNFPELESVYGYELGIFGDGVATSK